MTECEEYRRAMNQLRREGIDSHDMNLVLMAMEIGPLDYGRALECFRVWKAKTGQDWPVERWRASFNCKALDAGIPWGAESLLNELAREGRA